LASPNTAKGERIMKKDAVKVGGTYLAKVTDKVVPVRLDAENPHGGWDATNLATNKKVRIKSAQRLRGAAPARGGSGDQAKGADAAAAGDPDLVPLTKAMKPATHSKTGKPKAPKAEGPKKLSCLDAAYQVLQENTEPMNTKAMIDAIFAKKLWHSDAPTPAATLYSAILRELQVKKGEARFKKTQRGHFTVSSK
jgi:hypothetical protein